jgi:hypothetical protein
MKSIGNAIKIFILPLMIFTTSCTRFEVVTPDGLVVKQDGGFLLSREENFRVTHQWLDEENVLHEVKIERNTNENADAQERLIKAAFEMGFKAGAGKQMP